MAFVHADVDQARTDTVVVPAAEHGVQPRQLRQLSEFRTQFVRGEDEIVQFCPVGVDVGMLLTGAHEKQIARDKHIHPSDGRMERKAVYDVNDFVKFVRVRHEPPVVLRFMNPNFRRLTEKCTFLK